MKKVKKFIRRKTMIYKTGVEYGDYTINHVLGCSHGCKYPCYAYMMKKRFGDISSYEEWCEPALVENTLEILDEEIPKFKSKIHMLHLCFTTDPFMYESSMSSKPIFMAAVVLNLTKQPEAIWAVKPARMRLSINAIANLQN